MALRVAQGNPPWRGGWLRLNSKKTPLGAGGWPGLNSEKRLWVPHPCGFQGAGFDFGIRELETAGKW